MTLTDHQSQFFALELTRRCPADSVESLAAALVDAQVDLNPHQVDAALFAFRSPLSKGALLADEVGLGKTIEAGLVLSQRWAERRRRLLVIAPSNLRKQWFQELTEKFFLPCRILEARSYNAAVQRGQFRPFDVPDVVICSYQFACSKAADIHHGAWDLVVIDEAHRLRNVYKPSNVIANTLKQALAEKSKLLLTATPLQNSLLELFGLVSFIDEYVFGDLKSFREQFANVAQEQVFATLKMRIRPICHRTLRRQVLPYVKYTRRLPIVQAFTPEESEDRLYDAVSEYLRRPNLLALPASQRSLMTLVLRKLLASSTFAIAGALESMANRLEARLRKAAVDNSIVDELEDDYENLVDARDEWEEDAEQEPLSASDRETLACELADLRSFASLANSITTNAKGRALLAALEIAFAKARELGAPEKAILFTESRRTQLYLQRILAATPHGGHTVLFNGSNTDERSRAIYAAWLERHRGSDRITDSRSADMRSAIVDYFRDEGRILIATEAGAEGINLQFCSLVVNYDLPWNPQRIEQRIGRCHRYGQQHDVVVVNFLNRNNAADQRVFELLSEKFQLFDGVFGASDEVLGALESGVDFERRIAAIYQQCRRPDEIQAAFDQLQVDLGAEIDASMVRTRQQLLENFDDEVREKLRVRDDDSRAYLNRFERLLMRLTKHELGEQAEFLGDSSFRLVSHLADTPQAVKQASPLGTYELPRRSGDSHLYRLAHPLAEMLIRRALERQLRSAEIHFSLEAQAGKVSILETLRGRRGWLRVARLSMESLDRGEDHLLVAGTVDDGGVLDEEAARRLLTLPGRVAGRELAVGADPRLEQTVDERRTEVQRRVSERNAKDFDAEAQKLDAWADDLKVSLEREIKDIDREIKEARRAATASLSLEEKLAGQRRVKALEVQRNEKRRTLFEAQDRIDERRGKLIAAIEAKLAITAQLRTWFDIRWSLAGSGAASDQADR